MSGRGGAVGGRAEGGREPVRSRPVGGAVSGRAGAGIVRLRPRASVLLAVTSLIGAAGFAWPLLIHGHASVNQAHSADAPWIFVAVLPLLLAVVLGELSEGSLDAKAIALLGILAACGAALRVPSPGVAGFEPVFFLLIPAGRVLGRGFGFVLGAVTIAASALITGGVGPWLPFQMFGAAWMGFGAGCLPPARGKAELWLLAGYGAVTGILYGALLNLWFWPFGTGTTTSFSFVPGAGFLHNLHSFVLFDLTTSLGFDIPRAVTNATLVLLLGRPVLGALRRASRRAAFDAPVEFGRDGGGEVVVVAVITGAGAPSAVGGSKTSPGRAAPAS
ncbi:MAG: ECF transporter S component [Actinomycetota bacterium]|nr:ECF transporter S component [Actinomycetota bacterium]